jgi:hypothetical protein
MTDPTGRLIVAIAIFAEAPGLMAEHDEER